MRLLACILALVLAGPACKSEQDSDSKAGSVTKLLEKGQEAFKSGQYDAALQAYQEALQQQPDSAVIYNLMGMAYRFWYNQAPRRELKKKEIAAFSRAVELNPRSVVALVNLGASHYYSGDKPEAARWFKRAIELAPQHPQAEQLRKMIAEGSQTEPE